MAKRKIEIFTEIHSEKEFDIILRENADQLICAEIYSECFGDCIVLDRLFTKIKLDWSDGKMILLKVPCDKIKDFQRFLDQSEPVYIFILNHKVTKVFRGVHSIRFAETVQKELHYYRQELAGVSVERPVYDLDETTPDEIEWVNTRKEENEEELTSIYARRLARQSARKRHRAERMIPYLKNLNFVLFWPHCFHAHPELYERWNVNNIIMVGREEIKVTEETAVDIFYDGDALINEASMYKLLSGPVLAICFRLLDEDKHFVSLVRKILYEEVKPFDEAIPLEEQHPITAFDYYKSYSPTREEVWQQRRELRQLQKEEAIEKRARRLSEMQRLAHQAIEETIEAKRTAKEQLKLHLLKTGNLSALEKLKQEPDDEEVDIVVPEELSEEEEQSSEEEDENEYFPPPGLLIPGFYAPPNDVAKVNGLAILFPKLVAERVAPLSEFLPPHVLVLLDIAKKYQAIDALAKYKSSIIHMGIFKFTSPNKAVHIAYSVKQYEKFDNAHSSENKDFKIAFMLSMKTDLPLLAVMDLNPIHSREAHLDFVFRFKGTLCLTDQSVKKLDSSRRAKESGIMREACLFIFISTITLATCYCPVQNILNTGKCAYKIQCKGNLKGFQLPNECLEAANYLVTVDLTLIEDNEGFDDNFNLETLGSVTTLTLFGDGPQRNLSILHYTNRLQNLNVSRNNIELILGEPFYYLTSLENLDLSFNKLADIDGLFQFEYHPNKLSKLSLSHNVIEEVPGDAFNESTSLTSLDLSYNLITSLTEEPFQNLTNLEILRLNNNRIKDLNGAVNNLQNLKHLYLRGNQIQNIDVESLKIIIHLETFDVSWNQLEQIKPMMFSRHWKHLGRHSVCKIILSENHIASVPNGTAKEISARYARHLTRIGVDVLTELDLSNNEITDVEYDAFQALVKLISLNLAKNKIINFYVNPDDLAYVKHLNLSGNYITHLYFSSFSSMNNLINLDISHNKLDYIPNHTFTNNNNLKYVNMTHNDLKKVNSLNINMFHPTGGMLDLSHNDLTQIKIPYGEGLRLFELKLHSNDISDLALVDLIHENELSFLDLSNNKISLLHGSSLRLPVNLVYLDLSCNIISKISPSAFYRLGHLRTLKLSHNKLHTIEYGAFRGLIALYNLDISFNNIDYLDAKTLMDLKSLKVLTLKNNGMNYLKYEAWYSHGNDLKVIIDHNNFTCDWLAEALANYNNGFSKMRPTVLEPTVLGHSIEGIPCQPSEVGEQRLSELADDRLLITVQKILEAVKEQTTYLRKFLRHTIADNLDNNF
ncbi:hypothetical protein K1T71_010092 [Dendrolimus kikuchii]|uniref:Uncharacterized protein n=1 Tax=Dendrolimus kikuchii TaxID=765133 RepID=A0ACC1CQZ2_9NEOP|nr:hypothetical protein K1T71_010092 [Dendrolimus kikuchii]